MKKNIFCFILFFLLTNIAYAETYHGIDVDYVYATSDWSSKSKIKEIIDDYTYILQYNQKLADCSHNSKRFECLNDLAKDILRQFYNYNTENNIIAYENYVKATFSAYAVVYCQDKYNFPPGTICEQEKDNHTIEMMEQYIKSLLSQMEQKLNVYSFIRNYK